MILPFLWLPVVYLNTEIVLFCLSFINDCHFYIWLVIRCHKYAKMSPQVLNVMR